LRDCGSVLLQILLKTLQDHYHKPFFVGGEPLSQLWLFWTAPILGAIAAGFIYKNLLQDHTEA
jgi:glycerol uptake facilitator-like aquaporin